ncbi:short-chain dehydrogenase [Pedobacter lusitanus]|uniref:Short-chain dehydrogenase n=1 Tax=Pedobacter lusitanus TaxID=1503925 RepID=A0A0D0GV17_9SPHI|nr:SDR family oxidoreductase [Pedobacter lusitanus]KIO78256.1 short-chain dehydrogenase [Pedobacter lusitanus]
MILQNKNAIVYGAGSSLGGAVAQSLATAGATVFVTNKNLTIARQVADQIIAAGGKADAGIVDAMDEESIRKHIEFVHDKAGTVDISFNLIGIKNVQNIPLIEMSLKDFISPVHDAMHTQFLTMTAAGRIMKNQKSGVILSLTATPGGIGYAMVGGFGPLCCAIESLSRDLAAELGSFGVRVVNIRSAGSPDSRPFKELIVTGSDEAKSFLQKIVDDTMLNQLPLMQDIANTAVFLGSDMAGKISGVTIDVTAGTTAAINYKNTKPAFLSGK